MLLSVNSYVNNKSSINNPSFKQNYGYYSQSSKTKKYATGAASPLIPGLGQVINGETPKGIAFFLAGLCNYLLCFRNRKHMLIGGIARAAIGGFAAYDAYKKA